MSIGAMANLAHRRASQTQGEKRAAPSVTTDELGGSADPAMVQKATATATDNAAKTAVADALQVVMSYIPTEIITIYVAALGVVAQAAAGKAPFSAWSVYWLCLALTPVIVWIVFATKLKASGKKLPFVPSSWPLWEMVAAPTAFFAWATALPASPFADCAWHTPAVGSLVLLGVSLGLGLLAGLFR